MRNFYLTDEREEVRNIMKEIMLTVAEKKCNSSFPRMKELIETGELAIDDTFEGDIRLTPVQARAMLEGLRRGEPVLESRTMRLRRQVETRPAMLWDATRPIAYSFAYDNETWRADIRAQLDLLEAETCLRFREDVSTAERIEFTKTDAIG
ncbi:astacin metalloprotease, partial [Aphelenchoides avenae]